MNRIVFVSDGKARLLPSSPSAGASLKTAEFPTLKEASWELVLDHRDVKVMTLTPPPIRSRKDLLAWAGWKLKKEYGTGFDFFIDIAPSGPGGLQELSVLYFRYDGLPEFIERMKAADSPPVRIDLLMTRSASCLASMPVPPDVLRVCRSGQDDVTVDVLTGTPGAASRGGGGGWILADGVDGMRSAGSQPVPLERIVSAKSRNDFSPLSLMQARENLRIRKYVSVFSFVFFLSAFLSLAVSAGICAGQRVVIARAVALTSGRGDADVSRLRMVRRIAALESAIRASGRIAHGNTDWPLWVSRLGNSFPAGVSIREIRMVPGRKKVEMTVESGSLEPVLSFIRDVERENLLAHPRLVRSVGVDGRFQCLVEGGRP
jgi:hypothetical protein